MKMKVYSLLGFVNYDGSVLIGVFGSVEDVLQHVASAAGEWCYDEIGYVESELGEKVDRRQVEYVSFVPYWVAA
jgi:hypothetical protein